MPASERFAVGIDGTRLFYQAFQRAPANLATAVLCDGIACDGFIWKYLLPALIPDRCVIHGHYRGHGRSGPPRDPSMITVVDLARDVHTVLDDAGVHQAVLFGHSMGTQVCLEAYRQRPARIAGMVLLCGSYGRITRTFHGSDVLAWALPRLIDLHQKHPRVWRALWSRGPAALSVRLARFLGEVDPLRLRAEDLEPYFEHVNHLDPEMFLKMLQAAGDHSAEDLLPSVAVPVLVIAAERDTFTPVRYAHQMARQIPSADLLVVPHGSHTAPIEQPELVEGRIRRFLRERIDLVKE